MYQGSMKYNEILTHSIPFITAITPKIAEIRVNSTPMMMGGYGGLAQQGQIAPAAKEVSGEALAAEINSLFR